MAKLTKQDINKLTVMQLKAKIAEIEIVRKQLDAETIYIYNLSRDLAARFDDIGHKLPVAGSFTCYKKARVGNYYVIVELEVPAKALRITPRHDRKSRVSEAKVVSITTLMGHPVKNIKTARSWTTDFPTIKYTVGKIVKPDHFNANKHVQCTNGIHCFLQRESAVNY